MGISKSDMPYISHSAEETEAFGADYAAQLRKGDLVALEGDLGAGKTAFCRGVLRGLGYKGRVTSPTFAIANEYPSDKGRVVHFDMYRILDGDALYDIGFEEYLNGDCIILIEWSENIREFLPEHLRIVRISYGAGPEERMIETEAL